LRKERVDTLACEGGIAKGKVGLRRVEPAKGREGWTRVI